MRQVLDYEQVGVGYEVVDQLPLQFLAGMQGDPMSLVHVVPGGDVFVLLAQSSAVFWVRLEDHDRLTSDVCHEHEDLASDFEHFPVGPEGVLELSAWKLLDA